jgi:D-beta-D-heptose 7-phosphate kinase/D-beta-D-heptose 1-phosphate adenosyltransferase
LIVGLNSDASVRRLKGEGRPINNQEDRAALLKALRFVDEVVVFNADTPIDLITMLRPDIITKGGDYKSEDVVGNALAKVVLLPYLENYSTTRLINAA